MATRTETDGGTTPDWLSGGGETGALFRAVDWAKTPLGPIEQWSASLKATAGTVLHSRHPMFLWWGPDLIQIYNDAYLPSFGAGKHPAAMGQRGEDCWQEIWPIVHPQIDAVMSRGEASWNEDQLICVNRNDRLEEVHWTYGYSPVFNDAGTIGGTLVVCTETTGRVTAERRLRALRSLAQQTASATNVDAVVTAAADLLEQTTYDVTFGLVYLFDPAGQLTLVRSASLTEAQRDAADAAFRGKLAAAAGREALDLVSAGVLSLPGGPWPEPTRLAFVAPLAAGESTSGFVVFGISPRLAFDAAYRDHLVYLAEHLGRALARIETYRAREATASERDSLLMKAPVATALFRGPELVFELANPLYCRMVNRFDLVGKTYREAFPELVETPLTGILDRVYQTGEPFASGEMLVRLDRRGDGKLEDVFFAFNLEALRDGRGAVYGMMAVALEITEQVNARRALENAQKDREALLQELQTANRTKDEFLAMLGHELRNPLSPIVTALHLMKRRGDGRTDREQDIIVRQVNHLVRLVDDLLDVSKITRGKIALRREPVEIGEVVAKAVEIASDLFEQRRHRLVIDVPRERLRVDGDSVRLAQVIANLLTNAARYTPPGGLVTVRARRDGGDVVVAVKDNGAGIATEMLPLVFDLFVQGQQNTDRKDGGLGLGLSLVRSLVALHGGSVVARSEGAEKGSEFEVRLPATEKATGRPASAPVAKAPGPSRRVLVVDDSVDSAEMLREMLHSVGHEVAMAHDGPAALVIAEQFVPDVAVLDIGLPVMDGYEVGRRLHDSAQTARCRLIALTGYGQENDRARSKAAGFEAHLVKPVDLFALLRLVDEAPQT
jgi:signal transduction histidine kinase